MPIGPAGRWRTRTGHPAFSDARSRARDRRGQVQDDARGHHREHHRQLRPRPFLAGEGLVGDDARQGHRQDEYEDRAGQATGHAEGAGEVRLSSRKAIRETNSSERPAA